jgi:Lectin C-type domain
MHHYTSSEIGDGGQSIDESGGRSRVSLKRRKGEFGKFTLGALLLWAIPAVAIDGSSVTYPVNGHSYEVIYQTLNWNEARAAAAGLSTAELTCHLLTITSPGENAFVANVLNAPSDSWLGGQQRDHLDCSGANDAAYWGIWVTGEAWSYTHWSVSDGAPDDCGEACLSYGGSGDWENEVCTDTLDAYVVECEPTATPAPAVSRSLLLLLAVLMFASGLWALKKRASGI